MGTVKRRRMRRSDAGLRAAGVAGRRKMMMERVGAVVGLRRGLGRWENGAC